MIARYPVKGAFRQRALEEKIATGSLLESPRILCMVCLFFIVPASSETEKSSMPVKAPQKIIELVAGSYTNGIAEAFIDFFITPKHNPLANPAY